MQIIAGDFYNTALSAHSGHQGGIGSGTQSVPGFAANTVLKGLYKPLD